MTTDSNSCMNEPKTIKLIATKPINGGEWGFRRGQILMGYRESSGTFRVWALGQFGSNICGVPSRYIRRLKPGKMSRLGRKRNSL